MRVLVVEDTAEMQRSITRILETRGYTTVVSENGLEAFARLGEGGFAAIVCDLALPFLQGNQFYNQIRDTYPDLARRVVFVSGFATDEPTKAFLEETGQPYLAKPFEAAELLAAVDGITGGPAASS